MIWNRARDLHRVWCAVVWGLMVAATAGAATPGGSGVAPPPASAPAAEAARPIREQSIYIPYNKLREVFERQGRGVFLPYEEFEKLWRAAREKDGPPSDTAPPVAFLISEADHEAIVAKDVMKVTARIKIELLAEGWQRIPLGLADAAVTRAAMGEQPARIVFDPKAGYELLLEKVGKTAESVTLDLEYAKAYEKVAGRNSVSFRPPQAPVSRWCIRIPERGVKVDIAPLIAASEVSETQSSGASADETTVLAFVGAAATVQIDWTARAEGATGLASLATVQAEQQVRIDDGVIRTRTQLAYDISRAALTELFVDVPADQRVVNVLDANVRQWSIVQPTASAPAEAGRQRIAIQLFEPARSVQRIVVELEKFITEADQRKLAIPSVAAVDVGRQQGVVVVAVAEGLRAEMATHTGLVQTDPSELPKSLSGSKWLLSYRYASLPFDLVLQVEKVLPRITADSLVEASLESEKLSLDVLTVYTIERAGVFRLEYDVPAGYEVRKVAGLAVAEAQPVRVDNHYLEGPDKTHLVVNLAGKAIGRVALALKLQRRLNEADLLSPTGRSVNLSLSIPRATAATVERATGRLVIHAAESLRVNPGQMQGLRSVSFKEAFEGMASLREKSSSPARPVLAYTYAGEDTDLVLAVERRKPQITVRQLLVAQIEAGVIKYAATFTYDIQYSSVPAVRIDVPRALAPDIRNNTPGIREKTIDPPPEEDLADGDVAWSFTGETELAGTVQIRLSWEKKIEEPAVGKTIELALPRLRPRGVDRAWGQIVWTKAEALDVHESGEPAGVRPIDPQHDLIGDAPVSGAARAFEFHDDWSLQVAVTRYKLEEVKRASIERAVLQMVATRSGQVSVRGLYRLRSAGQRLAVKLPADVVFDNEPLRINGQAVAMERGEQGDFFIPLAGANADTPLLLEMRYSLPQGAKVFTPPAFPSEPAIQKVYLCAYLPEELVWMGSRGPWTSEMDWRWTSLMGLEPVSRYDAPGLLRWVREDLKLPGGAADTLQTDGRLYVFSTLHPTAAGEGALRLVAMNENWLSVIVFGAIVLLGVILLRFGATARYITGGVLLVVLMLSGVFLPTFARQIANEKLLAVVMIVLILWEVQYLVWIRPHDPAVIARKQAREAARLARLARGVVPVAVAAEGVPSASDVVKDEPKGGEPHA